MAALKKSLRPKTRPKKKMTDIDKAVIEALNYGRAPGTAYFDKDGKERMPEQNFKDGGLIGGQAKLDKNNDGEISGADFKMMKGGGRVKAKGYAMGGKVKAKGMAMGGKIKSKGMAMGGKVKAKGMAMGGKVKAKGMAMGGKVKAKGMAMGGKVKAKGMAMGGKVKAKGMAMGGKVKSKGYAMGGRVNSKGQAMGGAGFGAARSSGKPIITY